MSDITFQLTPQAQRILNGFKKLPANLRKALVKTMDLQNQFTIGYIQRVKLSKRGPTTLGVRTNRLRGSVRASDARVVDGNDIVSSIGSNVSYAGIHEFGGTTRPHVIRPKTAKALRWQAGGVVFFASVVHHPGSKIPARAPFRTGIQERAPQYAAAFSKTIVDEVKAL